MKIKGNIIQIENVKDNCIIENSQMKYEIAKTEELMKKKIYENLKAEKLEEYFDHVDDFIKNCNLYGMGSTKMRIIPEYRIKDNKIKVFVLMWNGTMESTKILGLPLKIKSGDNVLESFLFTELPVMNPNEFILFEGLKDNTKGLVENKENIVRL